MQKVSLCLFMADIEAKPFLDHYNAVAEAILSAKVEIYIADWWLSPELVRIIVTLVGKEINVTLSSI